MDQPDAGSAGMFSRWTNQMQEVRTNPMQEAWIHFHDGPIICRKCGYILMTDQSDAGSVDERYVAIRKPYYTRHDTPRGWGRPRYELRYEGDTSAEEWLQ
eukprot:7769887-Pyramimonas_sp.AAC.1